MRLLAEAGFKTFRIEIGFGSVALGPDEAWQPGAAWKTAGAVQAVRHPPHAAAERPSGRSLPGEVLQEEARRRRPPRQPHCHLADTRDLVVGRSGLNGLSGYWAAEALITAIDAADRPVPIEQAAAQGPQGGRRADGHLAYLPLYPVGTPGVRRHGRRLDPLRTAGLPAGAWRASTTLTVEIWNELTFGTRFLDINNYYDKAAPEDPRGPTSSNRGGTCWELARRTIEAVKREIPRPAASGASRTHVLHCQIAKLRREPTGRAITPTAPARGVCPAGAVSGQAGFQPGRLHAHDRHPHARGLGAHVRCRPNA